MKLESIKNMSLNKIQALSNKSEFTIQVEIVAYCKKIGLICFSVPNEATRNNSKYLKSGVLAGVSDLIVIQNGVVYFVELKDFKGKQSEKQKEFEKLVSLQGLNYYVVRSLDEFKHKFMKDEKKFWI